MTKIIDFTHGSVIFAGTKPVQAFTGTNGCAKQAFTSTCWSFVQAFTGSTQVNTEYWLVSNVITP